jgi:hypothetical protein
MAVIYSFLRQRIAMVAGLLYALLVRNIPKKKTNADIGCPTANFVKNKTYVIYAKKGINIGV